MTSDQPIPGREPPDADCLLAEAEWLRGLACVLVGRRGSDAVDDLVQDTMLVRLRSSAPAAGSERAWLRRVAVNLVHQSFRRGAARWRRERSAAAPELVESTSDVVARAQTHRLLVDALLELDEPFRSTLLRRFFDRAEPAEIAAEDGIPASTVRTRIHRGVAHLRRLLTDRYGGRRDDWLAGVAGFAVGGASPGAAVVGPAGALSLLGVSLMPKLLLGACAMVLAATIAWFAAGRGPDLAGSRTSAAAPSPEAEPELVANPARVPIEPEASFREEPATEPPTERSTAARGATVAVLVTGDGRERAGMAVAFQRSEYPAEVGGVHLRKPGDRLAPILDGRAEFAGLAAGQWWVGVLEGDGMLAQKSVEVASGSTTEVAFPLGAASIEGFVHDADGQPLALHLVRCSLLEQGAFRSDVRTDAREYYRFQAVPLGRAWLGVYADADFALPPRFMREFALEEAKLHRVDFGQSQPSAIWRGAVRNRLGQRVPGQEVDFRPGRLLLRNAAGARRIVPLQPDGTFEVALPPGAWQVRVHAPSQASVTELAQPVVITNKDLSFDLDLPWRRVEGRLFDQATGRAMRGAVLADVRVELWRMADEGSAQRGEAPNRLLGVHRVDGDTGVYLFDAVEPSARYEIRCAAIGATKAFTVLEDTDRLEVDLVGRLPR